MLRLVRRFEKEEVIEIVSGYHYTNTYQLWKRKTIFKIEKPGNNLSRSWRLTSAVGGQYCEPPNIMNKEQSIISVLDG